MAVCLVFDIMGGRPTDTDHVERCVCVCSEREVVVDLDSAIGDPIFL